MGRVWSRLAVVALVSGLVAVLADCKPKAGGKCEPGQVACPVAGGPTSLTCVNGTFQELTCRGPLGCTINSSTRKAFCDDSIANEGDACDMADTSLAACTVDRTKEVQCTGGVFKLKKVCRGPKVCAVDNVANVINCDTSLQAVGDPCATLGNAVCTPDHKQRLTCKDTGWAVDRYCRGAKGCTTEVTGGNTMVDCDETVASLNDPCGVPGYIACADNGTNELVCQGGKFVEKRACPKLGCHVLANNQRECQ